MKVELRIAVPNGTVLKEGTELKHAGKVVGRTLEFYVSESSTLPGKVPAEIPDVKLAKLLESGMGSVLVQVPGPDQENQDER